MSIDSKFLNLFLKATEKAAIGASNLLEKKIKLLLTKAQLIPWERVK